MSEEAEALGTVAGWVTRELIAAVIFAPFVQMTVQRASVTPGSTTQGINTAIVDQDMKACLNLADRLIALAKKNPPA